MKNIFLSLFLCFLAGTAFSQLKTPQPSPASKLVQTVGVSEITIEYSRPGVKGRKIFGDLVPFGEMWRTGANKNTMITFSDSVTVEGKKIPAGTYAIFTKPSASSWDIFFYTDTENWGTPEKWDDAKVAAKVSVKPITMKENIETMLFNIGELTASSCSIQLLWENTYISLKTEVPTQANVLASIDKTLAGPTFRDYYNSAKFYRTEGLDLKKAKEWMDLSIKGGGNEKFWVLREMSLLQAELGDFKGAIATAKLSLEASKKAEYPSYVKMNEESIAEWTSKL